MQHKEQVTFLLSVDTEEEWEWEGDFPESDFSVENLKHLPKFQVFCESIGIRPCYFVDYPAAQQLPKQSAFIDAIERATCELGAHLHPWANPPYFDKPTEKNSHVVNLPLNQVEEKLDSLMTLFKEVLNYQPKAFRTGRWGISNDIMNLLSSRGFTIDSSVYPFYKNDFFDCYGSPLTAYWPDTSNVLAPGKQRNIVEMPVTVGFNRLPFSRAAKAYELSHHPIFEALKTTAILWHTNMLRKIYFSPEVSDTANMIQLAEASIKSGNRCLHMYFHSSNLITNSTGFFKSDNAYEHICKRIAEVVKHLQKKYNVQFMTPSEYKVHLNNNEDQITL